MSRVTTSKTIARTFPLADLSGMAKTAQPNGQASIDPNSGALLIGVNTLDDRYFTEAETTALLAGKANVATTLAGYGITDALALSGGTIQPSADASVGLVIKGHSATQSGDLQKWQNSAGTGWVAVDKSAGAIYAVNWLKLCGTSQTTQGMAIRNGALNFSAGVVLGWSNSTDCTANSSQCTMTPSNGLMTFNNAIAVGGNTTTFVDVVNANDLRLYSGSGNIRLYAGGSNNFTLTSAGASVSGTFGTSGNITCGGMLSIPGNQFISMGSYIAHSAFGYYYSNVDNAYWKAGTLSAGNAYAAIVGSGNGTTRTGGKVQLQADGADRLVIDATGVAASVPLSLGPYTLATLPSASANAGKSLRITDRGQKHAYSDGTNWLFVHDNSVVV